MKIIYCFLFCLFSGFQINAQIQNDRINQFKLLQTLEETEKAIGVKINVDSAENHWGMEIANPVVEGVKFRLKFTDYAGDEGEKLLFLTGISIGSDEIKTNLGKGVGSTLDELWEAYKDLYISVWPGWDEEKQDAEGSIRIFSVRAPDEEANFASEMMFFLENNVVYKVEVALTEGY